MADIMPQSSVLNEDTLIAQRRGESDPHGKDPHSPGAKLDAGKPMVSLVLGGFARALEEVVKVGTYGARKYTPNGWMSVPNGIERYTDALGRHQLKEWQGELCDPDTELKHAAHLAWNALARLELMLRAEQATPSGSGEPSWPVDFSVR